LWNSCLDQIIDRFDSTSDVIEIWKD
jgi:hypothetical protein